LNTHLTILQITNRIPYPLNDGGNIATYNVTKYLNRSGNRVILASLNTKKHHQDPSVLSSIAKVYSSEIDTSITAFGLFKGLFSETPYNVARFKSEAFHDLLEKIIEEEKPDIIHIEGIYLSIYADTIKKKSTAPLFLRSHNVEYEIWERTAQNEKNPLKKWYLNILSKKIKKFELKNMHSFNAIMAITDRDADFYRKNNYQGKLKTISAGVDLELFQYKETYFEKKDIFFLGSMEWMPNMQGIEWYLENIWPVLHKKFPSLELHIAGKNMSDEMKSRKVQGVIFHGMIPDALSFMNEHAIMVVPLLSGGGMRLKIVEAMALGRCILSTSIGAEGIEGKNNYDLLIANSPDEFVNITESLITNKISADSIGKNARVLAQEKYSWEKLVGEMQKFYLELI